MLKSARARERAFTILMWIVSVVLAGFLIGLGGLVIGDLPKVSAPVQIGQFVDRAASARIAEERARLNTAGADISRRLDAADQALLKARNDYEAGQTTFNNWIATRTATTDPAQDPEVIARTRALDTLKGVERTAQQARDEIAAEQNAHMRSVAANDAARSDLEARAFPQYDRARFFQELQVFGLRLAFTLPLLAVAAFFLFQQPKGDYWPLKRGFVLFAAFAFFVELVPYLPEYGGYVRFGVGILLTLIVGHFIIRWMRNYLKTRAEAETAAEVERKKSIQYEEALKKIAANACPGCDRALSTTDNAATDYCVHCGMHLFNKCTHCNTRKFSFYRFCMSCGAPAREEQAAAA